MSTADPGRGQERGVVCEVGDALSWKHGVNWVGSRLLQLQKEPTLLAALCKALGVQGSVPAGPDVAQILWERETLSTL